MHECSFHWHAFPCEELAWVWPRCLTSRTATLWVTRIKTGTDQALPGSRWNWTPFSSLELWLGYLILWEKSESASIKMITCFTQNKSEQCLPLWSGHTLGHQVPGQLGCKWENGKSKSEIRKKVREWNVKIKNEWNHKIDGHRLTMIRDVWGGAVVHNREWNQRPTGKHRRPRKVGWVGWVGRRVALMAT